MRACVTACVLLYSCSEICLQLSRPHMLSQVRCQAVALRVHPAVLQELLGRTSVCFSHFLQPLLLRPQLCTSHLQDLLSCIPVCFCHVLQTFLSLVPAGAAV
jgi:hypothetical protein